MAKWFSELAFAFTCVKPYLCILCVGESEDSGTVPRSRTIIHLNYHSQLSSGLPFDLYDTPLPPDAIKPYLCTLCARKSEDSSIVPPSRAITDAFLLWISLTVTI